jgi:hypothetical protein
MSLSRLLSECPNIQDRLDAVWADKTMPLQPAAHLEFLQSQANTRLVKQQVTPGGSKRKTVEVTWFQRGNGNGVEGVSSTICTAEEQYGDQTKEYTISDTDNITTGGEVVHIEQLDTYCQDNGSYFLERLRWHVEWLERLVAKKSAQQAAALIGKYRSTVNPVDASDNLLVSTQLKNGNPDFSTMQKIKKAARKSGYGASPVVFADSLYDYFEIGQFAGCCAESGINVNDAISRFGIAVLYDDFVSEAMGGEEFSLMTEFGAHQLLTYTSAQRLDGVLPDLLARGSNYAKFSLLSPRGVPIDVTVKDDCGVIHIIPVATTKVIALPSDLFSAGDEFEGVNYLNGIKVIPPSCDEICYPPNEE